MLKIRLQRFGRKKSPVYRVVVTDSTSGPKSGKYVEKLGFFNPIRKEKKLSGDRIKYWISKGALLSDTVNNLLISEKIIEGKKINNLPKKSPIAKQKEESSEPAEKASSEPSKEEVVKNEDVVEEKQETLEPSKEEVVKNEEEVNTKNEDVVEEKQETVDEKKLEKSPEQTG